MTNSFRNHKPFYKRKELESLMGLLDANIVVRPGCTFLSCLITTSNLPSTDGATSSFTLTRKHSPILYGGIVSWSIRMVLYDAGWPYRPPRYEITIPSKAVMILQCTWALQTLQLMIRPSLLLFKWPLNNQRRTHSVRVWIYTGVLQVPLFVQ